MSHARKKTESVMAWTLDRIEEEARTTGCEVLFGPQRVKLVRTVLEYAPFPEAGPGRWHVVYSDPVTEGALEAMRSGITPDMLFALRVSDFNRGVLKKRLVELTALRKSIQET